MSNTDVDIPHIDLKTVFISYAHDDNNAYDADNRWLDRLCQHMKPLAAKGLLAIWSDKEIAMGDLWQSVINEHLQTAQVAVLLVSPAFLASEYIRKYEMPALLHRALNKELLVIPVLLRPCLFSTTLFEIPDIGTGPRLVSLAEFQAGNPALRPLNSLNQTEQDKIFVAVAQRVQAILRPEMIAPPAYSFLNDQPAAKAQDEASNREGLIKKVEKDWIEGLLNHTLYATAPLSMELTSKSESVERAWDLVVHQPGFEPQLHNTNEIATIFDDFQHQLLILGEPGAGKTVLLLILARHLLRRCSGDSRLPVPVVFTLSTWAERRESLDLWLVDELKKRYEVPRQLAGKWVANGSLLPLLDGLDELPEDSRDGCVRAINHFRETQQSMVVCSRSKDYGQLSIRLKLSGAVTIQPLTRDRVDRYLAAAGQPLLPVRDSLVNDESLYELFDTPLMLSVASVAFQQRSAADLSKIDGLEQRRVTLFSRYVDSVFSRPGRAKYHLRKSYSKEETISWLVWLSSAMKRSDQSALYLGWLQPSYLGSVGERAEFRAVTSVLLALAVGFASLFPLCLLMFISESTRIYQDTSALDGSSLVLIALGAAAVLAAFHGLMAGVASFMTHPVQGAVAGVVLVLLAQSFFHFSFLSERWALWLMTGVVSIAGWFAARIFHNAMVINPIERISWSWLSLRKALFRRAREGGIVGLAFGGFVVWRYLVLDSPTGRPMTGVLGTAVVAVCGLSGLLIGLCIALLFGGFTQSAVTIRSEPNSETKRSGMLAGLCILIALAPALVALVEYVSGLGFTSRMWVTNRWSIGAGAYIWAMCGIAVGGHFGGYFFLQHYALRWVLWRRRHAPARYVRFLDYAVELVLMRRVGGGYVFIHRMLLDYLASIGQPTTAK